VNKVKSYKFKLCGVELNATLEKMINKKDIASYNRDYLGTHYHAGFEWFFVTRAPLTVITESDTKIFEDGLICIPPHYIHTTDNTENFKMTFSYKPSKEEQSDFEKFMIQAFPTDSITVAEIGEHTLSYISALEETFSSDLEIAEGMAEALIKLIFSDIFLTNAKALKSSASKGGGDYLVKIDNIIGKFRSDITLATVAEALGVCPRQASRIIKKNYNSTITALMEKKRLGIAKDLLLGSDMSISEIVDYINFSSPSFFHSRFKTMYGVTPSEYRKNAKR